jgi:hypothetical protein
MLLGSALRSVQPVKAARFLCGGPRAHWRTCCARCMCFDRVPAAPSLPSTSKAK